MASTRKRKEQKSALTSNYKSAPTKTIKRDNIFDSLKKIEPLTDNQGEMLRSFLEDDLNILAVGSAGTGKTYLALYMALKRLVTGEADEVVIIRSAVPTRDIGFLPGSEKEKMEVYERIYSSMVGDLFGRSDAYAILKTKGFIRFESSSFLRGTTFDDSTIVVDECENFSQSEINTVMTRIGENTRIILCGDLVQTDLRPTQSGYHMLNCVIPNLPHLFFTITFGHDDIVRSTLVKDWIVAVEKHTDFYRNF